MYGCFTGLGCKNIPFHANKIPCGQHMFKHLIVKGFIFFGANRISIYVALNSASTILQFQKGGFPHDSAVHHSAGKRNRGEFFRLNWKFIKYGFSKSIYLKTCSWKGFNAHFPEFMQLFMPNLFLVGQGIISRINFHWCKNSKKAGAGSAYNLPLLFV